MTTLLTMFMVFTLSVFNVAPAQPLTQLTPNRAAHSDSANNIVPITISVSTGADVQTASLTLNNALLTKFDKGLYRYDLDTNDLSAGTYTLTFTLINTKGVSAEGRLSFEVLVMAASAASASMSAAPIVNPNVTDSTSDNTIVAHHRNGIARSLADVDQESDDTVSAPAPAPSTPRIVSTTRVLIINGKGLSALMLSFAPDKGLTIAGAPTLALTEPAAQPGQIAPAAQLPAPVSMPLAILLLVLVPQAVFALYWVTRSRNRRQKTPEARRSSTPMPNMIVMQDQLNPSIQ